MGHIFRPNCVERPRLLRGTRVVHDVNMTNGHSSVPFFGWLATQQHRDDPIGDLARDNAHDPETEAWDSPSSFVQYIGSVGSVEIQEAAINAAAEYMAWDQSQGS